MIDLGNTSWTNALTIIGLDNYMLLYKYLPQAWDGGDSVDIHEIKKWSDAELKGDYSHILNRTPGGGCEGEK